MEIITIGDDNSRIFGYMLKMKASSDLLGVGYRWITTERRLFYPKLEGIRAYLFRVLNRELHGLDPYKYRVCRHLAKGLGSFSRVLHSKERHV